jgi:hypothetical protein
MAATKGPPVRDESHRALGIRILLQEFLSDAPGSVLVSMTVDSSTGPSRRAHCDLAPLAPPDR